jgi:hypothetical protein
MRVTGAEERKQRQTRRTRIGFGVAAPVVSASVRLSANSRFASGPAAVVALVIGQPFERRGDPRLGLLTPSSGNRQPHSIDGDARLIDCRQRPPIQASGRTTAGWVSHVFDR